MKKSIYFGFSLISLIWAIAQPTYAQPDGANSSTVLQVTTTIASKKLQTVKVWAGHGVDISFYNTNQIIKKIWLDDPSQFIFDVDGCLEGLGKCSQNSGAGLIHIRQIEKTKIPGLPSAPDGAHMTVITEGVKKTSYHFRIVLGCGKPEYSQIEIIEDTSKPPETKPKADYTALSDSKYIAKGMQVALSKQWISRSGELWSRLNQLVELRSSGKELVIAANTAGVSMKLVEKLMNLGGKALLELPDIKPTTNPDLISNQK